MTASSTRLVLLGASAAGWGFGLAALAVSLASNGGLGHDSRSYWEAGRAVLDGATLYSNVPIDAPVAYRYPPLFAQMWAPFAVLPEAAFTWLWRLVCLISLRYLAGPWRNVGLWMLVPLTITELSSANVTFPVAAMTLAALDGHEWLVPWAAALKVGPVVLLPYLWYRGSRRHIVVGGTLLLIAAVVSLVMAPSYWGGYLASLAQQSSSAATSGGASGFGNDLIAVMPTVGADFAVRFAAAMASSLVAIRLSSGRLAFVASTLAAPALWGTRLVPLLATPRVPMRSPVPASRASHLEPVVVQDPRGANEPGGVAD